MLCQICRERNVARIFMRTCNKCVNSIYDGFDDNMLKWLGHANKMFRSWRLKHAKTKGPSYHGKTGQSPVNKKALASLVEKKQPIAKIARYLNVSERCVRRHMRRLGLGKKIVSEDVKRPTISLGKRAIQRLFTQA